MWRELSVDEGQRATAEGRVQRLPQGYVLVTDNSTIFLDGGTPASADLCLPLAGALDELEGSDVTVSGVWRRGALHVDDADASSHTFIPATRELEEPSAGPELPEGPRRRTVMDEVVDYLAEPPTLIALGDGADTGPWLTFTALDSTLAEGLETRFAETGLRVTTLVLPADE